MIKSRTLHKMRQALGLVASVCACASVLAAQPANTLPTGGQVAAGQAAISLSGNTMTVNQTSQRAVVNWDSYNVGGNAAVNYNQPNSQAVILNRVTSASASQIDGAIRANGTVIIANANGVTFGKGAEVNAGAVVATTMNQTDAEFMAGSNTWSGKGTGKVVNKGKIKVTDTNGYVALLAPEVRNQGVILATVSASNAVVAGAGEKVTLNFSNNKLIGVTVDKAAVDALIENKRAIEVAGGVIALAAGSADQLMRSVINNTGRISASSMASSGGRVELMAATVNNNGTIAANANGQVGNGGAIKVVANTVNLGSKSDMQANAKTNGNGGSIQIWANEQATVAGKLSATGGALSGNGGVIDTSAKLSVKFDPALKVDTSAKNGRYGQWIVDPLELTVDAASANLISSALRTTNVTLDATGSACVGGLANCSSSQTPLINFLSGADIYSNNVSTVLRVLATGGTINVNSNIEVGQVYMEAATLNVSGNINTTGGVGSSIVLLGAQINLLGGLGSNGQNSSGTNSAATLGSNRRRRGVDSGLSADDSTYTTNGGNIIVAATGDINIGSNAAITANGQSGGAITIVSQAGMVTHSGVVDAVGTSGQGGQITLAGQVGTYLVGALSSVDGATVGGTLQIGIAQNMGSGTTLAPPAIGPPTAYFNNSIPFTITSGDVYLANQTGLTANSSTGTGGTLLISGASSTSLAGANLQANGFAQGGTIKIGNDAVNGTLPFSAKTLIDADSRISATQIDSNPSNQRGGYIETSGQTLSMRASINAGRGGMWLIDPYDIVIDSTLATDISTALATSDVAVSASTPGCAPAISSCVPQDGNGNILVNSAISSSSSYGLTFSPGASGAVYLSANVTTGGAQTYNGNVVINGNITVSTTNAGVTITGSVSSGYYQAQQLVATTTGTLTVGSGSGAVVLGAAGKTLALSSLSVTSTSTDSSIAATITGATALTFAGTGGVMTLNATNTYTGVTTINGGILSVSTLANGGASSGIGQSTNAAANLVINGGTLQYTGAATSTDRVFTVGANGATLDASGTGTLTFTSTSISKVSNTNPRLTLTGSGSGVLSATWSGNGCSLTKTGVGSWYLSSNGAGVSQYTGDTTILGGVLSVVPRYNGNPVAGSLYIDGATLRFTGSTSCSTSGISCSVSGSFSIGANGATLDASATGGLFSIRAPTVTDATNPTLILTGTGSGSLITGFSNPATSGISTLNKTGTGIWTVVSNTYTGVTTISGGTLSVSTLANGGSASGVGASPGDATNLILDGGTLKYVGSSAASTNRLFTVGANGGIIDAAGTSSGILTFSSTGSIATVASTNPTLTLFSSNSFSGTNVFYPVWSNPSAGVSKLQVGTSTASGTWSIGGSNTYTGLTTVIGGATLSIANANAISTSNVLVTGTNSRLSITGYTVSNAVELNGGVVAGNNATLSGNVTLTANSYLYPNSTTNALNISGLITDNGGGYGLTIGANGYSGLLVLSNANTSNNYSGSTLVQNGATLRVSNTSALPSSTALSLNASGFDAYGFAFNRTLTVTGSATSYLFSSTGLGGDWQGVVTLNAPLTLGSTAYGSSAQTLLISGQITGSGGLANNYGTGQISSTANDYTGGTTVSGGTLKLLANAALPVGRTVTVSGGILDITALSVDRLITMSGGSIVGNGGELTGGLTLTGPGTLAAATGSTLTVKSGQITGNTGLLSIGDGTRLGTVLLKNDNTYLGGTNVANGVLKIETTGAVGTGAVTVSAGGFDLNGQSISNALRIKGTGVSSGGALFNSNSTDVTLSGLLTMTNAASIVADYGAIAFTDPGTITGSGTLTLGGAKGGSLSSILGTSTGGLTKEGTGTWLLSGANTYGGATTVSAGTLRLGSDFVTTTTAVTSSPIGKGTTITVSAGGTIDLNGHDLGTSTQISNIQTIKLSGTGATASTQAFLINSSSTSATVYLPVTLGSVTTANTLADVIAQAPGGTLTLKGLITNTASQVAGLQIGATVGAVNYTGTVVLYGVAVTSGTTSYTGATTVLSEATLDLKVDLQCTVVSSCFRSTYSGAGTIILEPATASGTIGIGATTGTTLYVPPTLFASGGKFADGFANIVIGSSSAGDLSVTGTAAFMDSVTLLSGGNITVNAGASVTSSQAAGNLVLAATGNFLNLAGSNALQTTDAGTTDRWVVYSNAPSTDNFGATGTLVSGNKAYWGSTYSTLAPSAVGASNRYVFNTGGTVTITTSNATMRYGTPIDLSNSYTVTNTSLDTAPTGSPYVVNSVADLLAIVPTIASTGNTATSPVGQYDITATGAVGSANFSTINYVNTGKLTVNPATITLNVIGTKIYDGTAVFDASPSNTNVTVSGLANGDQLATVTAHSPNVSANGSNYFESFTMGSGTASNYVLVSGYNATTNAATINKANAYVLVTAGQSSIYGSTPAINYTFYNNAAGTGGSAITTSTTGAASFNNEPIATSNAGTYALTYASGLTADNYNLNPATNAVSYVVNKATIVLNSSNSTVTYDGTAKQNEVTATVNGTTTPFSSVLGGSFVSVPGYSPINNSSTGNYIYLHTGVADDVFAISGAASRTNVGSTADNFALTAVTEMGTLASNYDIVYNNRQLTINPAPLGVSVTGTYSGSTTIAPTSFQLSGLVNTETVTALASANVNNANVSSNGANYVTALVSGGGTADLSNYVITAGYEAGSAGTLTSGVYSGTTSGTAINAGGTNTATLNKADAYVIVTSGQSSVYGTAPSTANYTFNTDPSGSGAAISSPLGLTGTATFTGLPSATSAVGSYGVNYDTGLSTTNYNINSAAANTAYSVTRATLTVTADNQSRVYGDANPTLSYTITGYQNSENASTAGLTGAPTISTAAVQGSNVGSYAISAAANNLAAANYQFSYANGSLTVGQRAITLAANAQSTTYGTALGLGTSAYTLSSGTLASGDAINAVTLQYNGSATVPSTTNAATYSNGIVASGATGSGGFNTTNYAITYAPGNLTVNAAPLTITGPKVYDGNGNFTYSQMAVAGAQNGETISLTAGSATTSSANVNTYSGTSLSSLAIGVTGGNALASNYSLPATGSMSITARPITLTAGAQSTTYGTALVLGTTDYTVGGSGLASGDAINAVTLQYNGSTTVPANTNAATYSNGIVASGATGSGGFNTTNYDITYEPANLVVNQKALSVTATATNMTYGATALPTLAYTSNGLVNGDTLSGSLATTAPVYNAGSSTRTGNVGSTYAMTQGTLTASSNYALTYTPADITVVPATLTVTPNNQSRVYGNANPTLTQTISGFVNGDNSSVVSGTAYGSTTATTTTNVGSATITATNGGLSATNYNFNNLVNGTLTITARPITLTASAQTTTYGTALGLGTMAYTTSGGTLASGDAISAVTLQYNGNATVPATTDADTYANGIVASAASGTGGFNATNYAITYVNAGLTVNPKPITVSGQVANNKTYDGTTTATINSSSAGLSGVVNGDAVTLNSTGAYGTFASADVANGIAVTVTGNTLGGAKAGNYTLSQPTGLTANITPAPLTVTANFDSKIIGQNDVVGYGGVRYDGLVPGQTPANLGGTLAVTRTNSTTNGAGVYTGVLQPSGLTSSNYTISYVNGDYTVVPADTLMVRSTNTSTTYGTAAAFAAPTVQYLNSSQNAILTLSQTSATGNTYTFSDGVGGLATFTLVATGPVSTSGQLVVGDYSITGQSFSKVSNNFTNAPVYSGVLTVTPKAVTASTSSVSKVYDGTTAMQGLTISLSGTVSGDQVTAGGTGAFAQANVGTNIGYSVSNLALSGNDSGNYVLTGGTTFSGGNGVITAAPLTVSGTKVYDGNGNFTYSQMTVAGAQNNETISLTAGTATTSLGNVNSYNGTSLRGLAINVTGGNALASNYSLPTTGNLSITQRQITVTADAQSTTYGTALGLGTSAYTLSSGTLASGDAISAVTLQYNGNATVPGTTNAATYSGGIVASGATGSGGFNATNYAISYAPADLTVDKANLAVTATPSLIGNIYNGNPYTGNYTTTLLNGDTATVTGMATGTDVGTYASNLQINGAALANYNMPVITNANLVISPKTITVSGQVANNKTYDGTTSATINSSSAGLSGVVGGDAVTLDASAVSGAFASANVANGIAVTVSGNTLGGAKAGNYTLLQPTGVTANITPATLTYTATAANSTYGSTPSVNAGTVTGFVNNETQASATTGTLVFTTTATSSSNVGSYGITGSGLTANNGNYTFVQAAGNSSALTIGARPITVTADAQSTTYGTALVLGSSAYTLSSGTLASGDAITAVTLQYNGNATVPGTTSAGTYTNGIVPSGAVGTGGFNAINYAISYLPADLTVLPQPQPVPTSSSSAAVFRCSFSTQESDDDGVLNYSQCAVR